MNPITHIKRHICSFAIMFVHDTNDALPPQQSGCETHFNSDIWIRCSFYRVGDINVSSIDSTYKRRVSHKYGRLTNLFKHY